MTYSPIQLSAIKLFGKKDLSFGCVLELKEKEDWDVNYFYVCKSDFDWDTVFAKTKEKWYEDCTLEFDRSEYEILWHEPHLEDVFRVAEDKKKRITIEYYTQWPHLIINPIEVNLKNPERIEYNPTLPLLEQSEETLTQLINLFK